ncbi:MAG: hypothetical protein GXY55_09180 [Phycisphaerae bacterium]|nr:hypothetical protein [Phycisphaerae bacterium]
MARRLRTSLGEMAYHVMNRVAGGEDLFKDGHDDAAFERVLAEAREREAMRICAYALMLAGYVGPPRNSAWKARSTHRTAQEEAGVPLMASEPFSARYEERQPSMGKQLFQGEVISCISRIEGIMTSAASCSQGRIECPGKARAATFVTSLVGSIALALLIPCGCRQPSKHAIGESSPVYRIVEKVYHDSAWRTCGEISIAADGSYSYAQYEPDFGEEPSASSQGNLPEEVLQRFVKWESEQKGRRQERGVYEYEYGIDDWRRPAPVRELQEHIWRSHRPAG